MGSVRFEPLLAGRPVGMLSIEPAAGAAAAGKQTLLPLVAAALGRASGAIASDRQRAEAEFLLGLTEAAQAAGSLEELLGTLCARVAAAVGARRTTVLLNQGGLRPAARRAMRTGRGTAPSGSRCVALRRSCRRPRRRHSGEPVVARAPDSPLLADSWAGVRDPVAGRGRDRQPAPRRRRSVHRRG